MGKIKIKKDDQVLVISGKDKGKKGNVIRVISSKNQAVVEGVNISTRHIKARPGVSQTGIVKGESPIHVSNLLLIDPETGKSGRVYKKTLEDGSRVRMVKSGRR